MRDFLAEVERVLPGTLRTEETTPRLVPGSATVVARAIALANETRTRLSVPGSTPIEGRPCVAVDRLDGIISVDETSRVLHVQAGITLSAIEARARDHGWTLDVPTRWHSSQVGTWLADGAPGRRRKADDPVSQFVAGMELVLPTGQEVTIRPAPRRAVGPDLVRAVIGAGGRLGVIVGVHCIAERAAARARLAFSFPDARKASRAL
ncbi:MAG: FAD-binding protein, partial [Myxococcota bacterium]